MKIFQLTQMSVEPNVQEIVYINSLKHWAGKTYQVQLLECASASKRDNPQTPGWSLPHVTA